MRGTVGAGASILFALYPLLIFAGLHWFDPRILGILLIAGLLLRLLGRTMLLIRDMPRMSWISLLPPAATSFAVAAYNSEILLLLYPSSINAGMLLLFGSTLIRKPTMIERIARMENPNLSPKAIHYTCNVTIAWCVFFCINGGISIYTALWTSRETWVLYNGFIAYLLMGFLFFGERLIRQKTEKAAGP